MFFENKFGNGGLLEIEVVHAKETADVHVVDLGTSNMRLMEAMCSELQCCILEALGEIAIPRLWKWFIYQADGIISWYEEGKVQPVRAIDEHLLVPHFVKQMESRCCQWYGEGRIK